MIHYLLITLIFHIAFNDAALTQHVYKTRRGKIIEDEALRSVGGDIQLTDKESSVNNCLMRYKFKEVDYAFDNPQYFNFSHHYFNYKDGMKKSSVYRIIKDMPKGAALHIHDMALMSPDYLVSLTYMDNLYICFKDDGDFDTLFSNTTPNKPCGSKWELLNKARKSSGNAQKFDAKLRRRFTLVVDNPDEVYPTIKETWGTFKKFFGKANSLLTYRPNWEKYCYSALKRFREDNVMHVEVRSILPNLYELDGSVYDTLITAKAYQKCYSKFLETNDDFIAPKLIYAPSRRINRTQLEVYLETARQVKKEVPDIFVGFDLVGQEDTGSPLVEFVPQLEAVSSEFNFFFHAGETDWYGTHTDENLIDAILLGAKRLGHAYALPKHPILVDEVKKKDIGLEVSVVSNAVLSLVRDIRNHPLATFLAEGLPVVISSDDPGVWEASPLTDDFYLTFVGVASKFADLRMLKKLALNSLKYSALGNAEKAKAYEIFNKQWLKFINEFDCLSYQ